MKTATTPRPVLRDDQLYLGDNGRITCGAHAGMSARFTGRALDGMPVVEITGATLDAMLADLGPSMAHLLRCEVPSCACTPKRVIVPMGGGR